MKYPLLLFSVLSATLVTTHSFSMVLEQVKESATLPTSSAMDNVKTSETSTGDSVPVLSQPEVMVSTLPMSETVLPPQMTIANPLMTNDESEQIMTENMDKNMADQTMAKPVGTEEEEVSSRSWSDTTATDVLKKIYEECLRYGSFACVKPKVLSFLSTAVKKDKILLTDDLIIEKTGRLMKEAYEFEQPQQVGSASSTSGTFKQFNQKIRR
jgi:hypothetical protein